MAWGFHIRFELCGISASAGFHPSRADSRFHGSGQPVRLMHVCRLSACVLSACLCVVCVCVIPLCVIWVHVCLLFLCICVISVPISYLPVCVSSNSFIEIHIPC